MEYFYDTDPGYGKGKSVGNLTDGDNNIVVSVEGLSYGVHYLCFRAQDNQGVWSQVATYSVFVTSPQTANAVRIEYFFDTDPGYGMGTSIGVAQDENATYALPLDGLSMGAHMLYLRVQDNHGRWSSVQSHPIYVMNNLPDVVAVEYFFDDDDPGEGQATSVPLPNFKTEPFAFEANTDGLSAGEHHMKVRLQKNNGFWTLFDAATFTVEGTVVAEAEPYAVLTNNDDVITDDETGNTYSGKTLTLYYDDQKAARNGMSVGPDGTAWYDQRESITKAIFDPSFANCTSITNTAYWFYKCTHMKSIVDMSNLKTDNVTDMSNMFAYCSDLTTLDLSGFKTDNVTNMSFMFCCCSGLTSLDVSGFKTDNVTNMENMFFHCSGLTSLDVSGFKTDNVTSMYYMFDGCSGLTSLDLSTFKTNNVTDMSSMFAYCSGLTSLDVSGFKTDNVTDMSVMFYDCSSLTSLGLSSFKTDNVTEMYGMFNGCSSLTSLDLSSFKTDNVTRMDHLFDGCSSLTSIDLSGFKTDNVTRMERMFYGCSSLTTIYAGGEWSTATVTEDSEMFQDCEKLVGGRGTFYDANHTDKAYAHIDGGPSNPGYFTDKNATPEIAEAYAVLSDNNTVLTFYYDDQKQQRNGMGVGPFLAYDARGWHEQRENITNVVFDESFANDITLTSTAHWFYGCRNLTTITGISNLRTDNVRYMRHMFRYCTNLTELDVREFNTENVEDMRGMFYGCSNLVSLDVRNFDMSKVNNGEKNMFTDCSSLACIIAGNAEIPAEEYAQIQNPNLLVYVNEPSLAPQGVQNVVVNGVAKEIVLTDVAEGNNNFFVPQSFTAERITYTRNFAQETQPNVSRGWESISLPFNVQNIVHETKGELAPFGSTAEGKKFWLRRLADNGLTRALQIEANVPYVISMPNSSEYTDQYNLAGRVTFFAENTIVPVTKPQVLSLADSSIVMMPTMLRVNRSSSVWALNVGEVRGQYLEGSVFERDYRTVRPFQAYTIHYSDSPAPRFVPIADMNSDATGIEDVRSKMEDGRGDVWYDLNGRKLQQKPDQKGVYLKNGRKVVVH